MKTIQFTFDHARVSDDRITESKTLLQEYAKQLQEAARSAQMDVPEASMSVPHSDFVVASQKLAETYAEKNLAYVVVAGIGGSNLGAKAVYDALRGQLDAYSGNQPKLIFLDTVSPTLIYDVQTLLKTVEPERVLVNVISKSGTTMETVEHLNRLAEYPMVFTTDEGSALWKRGEEEGIPLLPIPKLVGGRYSVFTNVGLFPLALAGIDIDSLVNGAREMIERCGTDDIAATSAALIALHREEGILINNQFFFNPELESLGKWYRQLMGESVGKMHDLDGNVVHRGVTPIVSIGSTDLHSMVQLYLGGPRDKFTYFVYADQKKIDAEYARVMSAIYEGVKSAYASHELPFAEISLPEISASTIGSFMQFRMMEMMYLAKLLNVNAFDQPNVEDYKTETRRILSA